VAKQLNAFRELAMGDLSKAAGARLWSFLTLGYRARIAKRIALQLLDRSLQETALDQPEAILTQSRQEARDQVKSYIDVVRTTAEFAEWERLFSLWHVIHIPFVYLLVLCGVIHVFAVHMY
jgi:acyl-CoA reductase-like NAD-dependent aldehyde dehydrogenase